MLITHQSHQMLAIRGESINVTSANIAGSSSAEVLPRTEKQSHSLCAGELPSFWESVPRLVSLLVAAFRFVLPPL